MQVFHHKNVSSNNCSLKKFFGIGYNEYLIILSLLSVFSIAAFKNYGQAIQQQAAGIAVEIAGAHSNAASTENGAAGEGEFDEGQVLEQVEEQQAAEQATDQAISPAATEQQPLLQRILANLNQFADGLIEGVKAQGQGMLDMILHPIDTVQAISSLVEMLMNDPEAVAQAILDEFSGELEAIKNGDVEAIGRFIGENVSPAAILGVVKKAAVVGKVAGNAAGKTPKGKGSRDGDQNERHNNNEQSNETPHVPNSPVEYDHVLKGDFNRKGRATGGHSLHNDNVRVVAGTKGVPDGNGVYKAEIEVQHPETGEWIKKNNKSHTMFPDHWSADRIKTEIDSAWNSPDKIEFGDNEWRAISSSGVTMGGYTFPRATAFPIKN